MSQPTFPISHILILCFLQKGVLRHGFDPLMQKAVNSEMKRSGIDMRTETQVASVVKEADGTLSATLSNGDVVRGLDTVSYTLPRSLIRSLIRSPIARHGESHPAIPYPDP